MKALQHLPIWIFAAWLAALGIASSQKPISTLVYLLALTGIYALATQPEARRSLRHGAAKALWVPLLLFLIATIIAWGVGGFSSTSKVETFAKVCFIAVATYAAMHISVKQLPSYAIKALLVAACIGGAFILWRATNFNAVTQGHRQDVIPIHSLSYSNICLAACFIMCCLSQYASTLWRVLGLALFALGVVSVFYLRARGAWLAIPGLALLLVLLLRGPIRFIIPLAIAVTLLALFLFLPSTAERLQLVLNELRSSEVCTSVGIRLHLWSMGADIWQNNPLFGIGYGNFGEYRDALIASGQSPACVDVTHLHNDYIGQAARSGIFGVLTFTSIYLAPALYAVVTLWGKPHAKPIMLAIVGLSLQFATGSLTEELFARSITISCYVIMMAALLAAAHLKRQSANS